MNEDYSIDDLKKRVETALFAKSATRTERFWAQWAFALLMEKFEMNKNLDTEKDTTRRNKGHAHLRKHPMESVCPECKGLGFIYVDERVLCPVCEGEGIVFEEE